MRAWAVEYPPSTTWKVVIADGLEATGVAEVHVMCHVQRVRRNLDRVQRVSFSFATSTRSCCAALDDDDALMAAAEAWIEVERITDVGSMQMPAKDHIDPHLNEPFHRSLRLRHGLVAFVVRRWCEVMMGDNDLRGSVR